MLGSIPMLQARYDVPIGYSDHTLGYAAGVLAASMGVEWFEKHFTLAAENGGLDAKHSTTPATLRAYCDALRETRDAMAQVRSDPSPDEVLVAKRARRGLYLARDLPAGHALGIEDLSFLRPESDFALEDLSSVIGRTLTAPVQQGEPLQRSNLDD